MKKILVVFSLLLCVQVLNAQGKVNNVVDDDYVRSSVSVIVVNRGDSYDSRVFSVASGLGFGEKFDVNEIPTDRIMIKADRKNCVETDLITSSLEREGIGKEIISYWFQRDASGRMSDELILKRGMYSVRDQEILNSQVSKVGISALGEKGYDLLKGSYVYVLDYYNFTENVKKKNYSAELKANIYQLECSDELMEQLYEAWIYDEDSPEVIAQKNALFDSLVFPLVYVTTVEASASSSTSLSDAVRSAFSQAFYRSEKAVDGWNVTSSIISTRPIKAKIGTKEGVTNGQRFQVHKIVEDRHGNIDSKSVGYVRATEVANNSNVATGDTEPSCFYQISGLKIDEGMILKQKNDLKMGVTVAGGFGGYSPFEIGLEFLSHINTKGTSRYVMLDVGIGGDSYNDLSVSYIVPAIGMGIAVRPIRPVEIMPFIQIGMDILSTVSIANIDYKLTDWSSYVGRVGARASWQVVYPIQIFAQAEAAVNFGAGSYYAFYNDIMLAVGKGHKQAVAGFSFGVKVNF